MSFTAKKHRQLPKFFICVGLIFIGIAAILLLLTFFPIISEEIKYSVSNKTADVKKEIVPVDREFGIVIPKILANAKVIDHINPYNEKEYQWALTKGVAHAEGSAYPGHAGNTFIFAHSSGNWYDANRYNSVFYLLSKLEKGDKIFLYYRGQKTTYEVVQAKVVSSTAVNYLQKGTGNSTVTLMTCWPPGTTLERLIVVANLLK